MNMIVVIKGVGELKHFTTQSGKSMCSREFIGETIEQYPQRGCFTVRNALAEDFGYVLGEHVNVHFSLSISEGKEHGMYFNRLGVWRIDRVNY